ncbi:MAG: hypothetical protein KDA20_08335 [Phycisphaerales bacterium]|nr:hypothetical protein [Phycisphaerales bacterium]
MLHEFKDMLESLQVPQTRHAILVHLPIVFSGIAMLLALAAAFLRQNKTLRWLAAIAFVVVLGTSFLATNSGELAEGAMGEVSQRAHRLAHEHEELAESVWMFALGGLVFAGLAFAGKPKWLGPIGAWLAVLAGIAGAGWVANTAHHGGKLVYRLGVGTPHPVQDEKPVTESMLAAITDPRARFFLTDVRPVLRDRCMGCHSGDDPARGLDLTSIDDYLLRDPTYGQPVVPGNPDNGILMRVINWTHETPEEDMPKPHMPPGKRDPLTPEQIASIAKWITDGAVWIDPPAE